MDGREKDVAARVVAPVAEPVDVAEPLPQPAPPAAAMAAMVADLPGDREAAGPTIRLEEKHPRAIRWMHWINFPVLFTMIWSGLLIYWGDSDNAYQHPHRIYQHRHRQLHALPLLPRVGLHAPWERALPHHHRPRLPLLLHVDLRHQRPHLRHLSRPQRRVAAPGAHRSGRGARRSR